MIPYSRQSIDQSDIEAVTAVLRSSHLTQGPAVERFERDVTRLQGIAHGIAVANATCALHLACLALGARPGAHVWTVPTTFVASANCALYCGATIDFVDIEPATRLMSVAALAEKLERSQRDGTLPDIVIPVDLSGLPCDYAAIRKLADRYGFKVLADCSHSLGARYHAKPVGSEFVDIAVFSFHAVKIVTTGEGGLVATNDDALAARVRLLHSHGITRDPALMSKPAQALHYYEQLDLGFNYRMTDIQAALGSSQLERLPQMAAQREQAAQHYDNLLEETGWILPARFNDRQSAWHLYVIEGTECDRATRDGTMTRLRERGFGVNLHYLPVHLQPFYRRLGFAPGQFPNAERYAERAITIPLYPKLTREDQDAFVDALLTKS